MPIDMASYSEKAPSKSERVTSISAMETLIEEDEDLNSSRENLNNNLKKSQSSAADTPSSAAVSDCEEVKIPALDKYNLRTRSIQNRIETEKRKKEPRKPKPKQRPPPLSKYRRKTANMRERSRMQEMNIAFEELRKAVPEFPMTEEEEGLNANSKLTKITTLRLAVNYIDALTQILKQTDPDNSSNDESDAIDSMQIGTCLNNANCLLNTSALASFSEAFSVDDLLMLHRPSSCGSSDQPSCSSPSTTETESLESLKSCCWPDFSADDSLDVPDAFDLILESDGESMQLSDDLIT